MKWTFDNYLGFQLRVLSFMNGGTFTYSDVKKYFKNPADPEHSPSQMLTKLYQKEFKAIWAWDSYNDRTHLHLNRVVTSLGGERQKVRNKWVYRLTPKGFITGA